MKTQLFQSCVFCKNYDAPFPRVAKTQPWAGISERFQRLGPGLELAKAFNVEVRWSDAFSIEVLLERPLLALAFHFSPKRNVHRRQCHTLLEKRGTHPETLLACGVLPGFRYI